MKNKLKLTFVMLITAFVSSTITYHVTLYLEEIKPVLYRAEILDQEIVKRFNADSAIVVTPTNRIRLFESGTKITIYATSDIPYDSIAYAYKYSNWATWQLDPTLKGIGTVIAVERVSNFLLLKSKPKTPRKWISRSGNTK